MNYAGVIASAGLSSRMGDFKPLLPYRGRTFIECCIDTMMAAGAARISVVLGHRAAEIEAVLARRGRASLSIVYNRRYAKSDMYESVRLGLEDAAASSPDGVFVMPVDVPAVRVETFLAVAAEMEKAPGGVVVPVYNGKNMHPPLIHASCLDFFINGFSGDGGLKAAYEQCGARYLAVDDPEGSFDADTPEDYRKLRGW